MNSSPPSLRTRDADGFCQVCGKPAHGMHFTVVSCRACAAFFQRSAAAADSHKYKCRRSTEDCDVANSNCRLCRWKRCRELGMAIEAVRRKKKEPTENELTDRSALDEGSSSELEEEKFTIDGHKFNVDCSQEMQMIIEFLNQPTTEPRMGKQTPLQVLIEAYKNMVPGGKPETIKITNTINATSTPRMTRELMKRVAKWAMQCDEFAQLPLEDKRKMFCNFWAHVYTIERCARTEEFLESQSRPELLLQEDDTALNLLKVEYFIPGLDDEKTRQINDHFQAFSLFSLENFVLPMRELNLTRFEVVYMCLFKMWSISKIPGLSPQTYETAEELLDAAGSELHEFYTCELRMKNYAKRISKLFGLMIGLESTWRARTATLLTADVGELIYSDYNHSELSDFSKYVE